MKIRTPDEFTDKISRDLAKRKQALTSLLAAVGRCRPHEGQVISNGAICILYAHWEGFVKFGGTCLANYVYYRGVAPQNLSNAFIAAAVRDKLKEIRGTNKITLCREFVDSVRHPHAELTFSWQRAVKTYDNLKMEVLMEVLQLVGCDPSYYETKKGLVDERLVRHRNSIAHTGYSDFEFDDYPQLHTETVSLLEHFRDDLENAVTHETFKIA